MITVTSQEAMAKLNQMVEISPQLTGAQAKHFWDEIVKERKKEFSGSKVAIQYLKRLA